MIGILRLPCNTVRMMSGKLLRNTLGMIVRTSLILLCMQPYTQ